MKSCRSIHRKKGKQAHKKRMVLACRCSLIWIAHGEWLSGDQLMIAQGYEVCSNGLLSLYEISGASWLPGTLFFHFFLFIVLLGRFFFFEVPARWTALLTKDCREGVYWTLLNSIKWVYRCSWTSQESESRFELELYTQKRGVAYIKWRDYAIGDGSVGNAMASAEEGSDEMTQRK